MAFEQLNHPLAITMWDFSWLERRWPGGGYEDWDRALDGLVERGYDAVRIDAYPHLVAHGADRAWDLVPVWDQHEWGSTTPIQVRVQPALNEFVAACRDRGLKVGLSTWFREDTEDVRMRITSAADHAQVWIETLRSLEADGLLDTVVYVDLCNEFPLSLWAPFLYRDTDQGYLSRHGEDVQRWMADSIGQVRAAYPQLPYCYSVTSELWAMDREPVDFNDFLEPHVWMAQPEVSDFYERIGYDLPNSRFDPKQTEAIATRGAAEYRADPAHWQRFLVDMVRHMAACAERSGKPLATTECWAVVNYKDGDGFTWDWMRELCAVGVRAALATQRWALVGTSNFCGPQFGMWDDVAWHRALTDEIHQARFAHPGGEG